MLTDETTRMKRRSHLFKTKNDWIDLRSRLVEAPGAGDGDTGLDPPSDLWDRVPIAYLSRKAQKVEIDDILNSIFFKCMLFLWQGNNSVLINHENDVVSDESKKE